MSTKRLYGRVLLDIIDAITDLMKGVTTYSKILCLAVVVMMPCGISRFFNESDIFSFILSHTFISSIDDML